MWRNLAKVQSTIQVIGNAVAPAFGSDDEDDDEEDEEVYDDEEDYNNEGEDEQGAAGHEEWDRDSSPHQQLFPRTPYQGGPAINAGSAPVEAEDEEDDDIHSQMEFASSSGGGGAGGSPSSGYTPPRRKRGSSGAGGRSGSGSSSGPLGLVGFLAHALDSSQRDHSADDDDDDSSSRRWRGENKTGNNDGNEGGNMGLEPTVGPVHSAHPNPDQTVPTTTTTSAPWKEQPANGVGTATTALEWRATPPREDGPEASTDAPPPPPPGGAAEEADDDPPPRRFSLVRESGSVSPYGSPQSVRSVSRSDKAALLPALPEGSGRGAELETMHPSPPPARPRLPSPRPTVHDTSPRMLVPHRWSPPPPDAAHASPVRTEPSLPSEEPSSQASPLPLSQPSLPPTATASVAAAVEARFPRPPPSILTSTPPFSSQKNGPGSDNNRIVERERQGYLPAPPFVPPAAAPPLPPVREDARPARTDRNSNGSSAYAANNKIATASPTKSSGPPDPSAEALVAAPPSSGVGDGGAVAGESLPPPPEDSTTQLLECRCHELEQLLAQSQDHCRRLEGERDTALASAATAAATAAEAAKEKGAVDNDHDRELLLENFQQKEARLLAAAAEDREREVRAAQLEGAARVQSLHHELEHEREVFARERECLEQLVADAQARAERAERHLQRDQAQRDQAAAQHQKQLQRELQMSADQLAQTMALLDEREEQVKQLKALVQSLQSRLSEHAEGAQLAEDEVEELHHENEELRERTLHLEGKCAELRGVVEQLQSDSTKLSEVKVRQVLNCCNVLVMISRYSPFLDSYSWNCECSRRSATEREQRMKQKRHTLMGVGLRLRRNAMRPWPRCKICCSNWRQLGRISKSPRVTRRELCWQEVTSRLPLSPSKANGKRSWPCGRSSDATPS